MHTADDAGMIRISRVMNGWILERSDEGKESFGRKVYADSGLRRDERGNSLAQLISDAFEPYMQTSKEGGLRVSVTSIGYETQEEVNKLFT